MKNYYFLCLIMFCLISQSNLSAQMSSSLSKAGFSEDGMANFEAFIQNEIDQNKIAGANSLIYRKGVIAQEKTYGSSNLSTGKAMDQNQLFFIQSMTKPIISIAFMQLYEEGHFQLTDPVSKYIPEFADLKVIHVEQPMEGDPIISFKPLESPILIWHLLSHTAGFSHGLGQNEYETRLYRLLYETPHETIKDRVAALLSYPLMGQPGKQWNYSASPDVLALLIQQFSGMTPGEYLQKNIFSPLGMDDTFYKVPDDKKNRIASLHMVNEEGQLNYVSPEEYLLENNVEGGTHGLFSTPRDYLQFGKMILADGKAEDGTRIIGRKTLELMAENHIEGLPYGPGNGFGLGFGVRTDISDSKLSGSNGTMYWGGAFSTYFFVDPEEDLVAIWMMQLKPFNGDYRNRLRQYVYSAIDD